MTWTAAKNERRSDLVERHILEGLDAEEFGELETLQDEMLEHRKQDEQC